MKNIFIFILAVLGMFFLPRISVMAGDASALKPLYFDPAVNNIIFSDPQVDFELMEDPFSTIRLGPFLLNEKSFFANGVFVSNLQQFDSHWAQALQGKGSAGDLVLFFNWPVSLIPQGRIEVYSQLGNKLMGFSLKDEVLQEAQALQAAQKKTMRPLDYYHFLTSVELSLLRKNKIFRFCLSEESWDEESRVNLGYSRLCSRYYGIREDASVNQLGLVKSFGRPQAILNQENLETKVNVAVPQNQDANFYIESNTGMNYQFFTKAQRPVIMDISANARNETEIILSDVRPYAGYRVVKKPDFSVIEKKLSLEATIGDLRTFYQFALPPEQRHYYYPGPGGGVFRQEFTAPNLPSEEARVYLDEENVRSTYSAEPTLYATSSNQKSLQLFHQGKPVPRDAQGRFAWNFQAPLKGQYNSDQLTVEWKGKKYLTNYELYRGYSSELALRGSGVVADNGTIYMLEGNYSHWFENILGWESPWISRQRWGVNGRVFRSLSALPGNFNFNFMVADLKYRFPAGLWTRDEALGVMLTYQNLEYGNTKAGFYGPGAFWARSMPEVLDDFFSNFPLLKQKKWLHLDFQYYANALSSTIIMRPTYVINMQGQILWTPRFFGEAGFSYKKYDLDDNQNQVQVSLGLLVGTVGLGYKF